MFESFCLLITNTYAGFIFFTPFNNNKLYISYCKLLSTLYEYIGINVYMCGDTFNPNEKSVILCNHKSYLDIISAFFIASHYQHTIGF